MYFLYSGNVGSISYPITTGSRGSDAGRTIILAILDDRKESGEIPLEEAAEEIKETLMLEKKKIVIDLSADYRFQDVSIYEKYYYKQIRYYEFV